MYWKDVGGVLLNFLLKDEADKVMQEFHEGDCGWHLYWKTNTNKILRADFYWPTLFFDVHKKFTSCHQCKIFEGKRKLFPLPLKPISIETPFQQWGLDFIIEINLSSSTNINGFLQPLIILPNGLNLYLPGNPLMQWSLNSSKTIFFQDLDVLGKSSQIMEKHSNQRTWWNFGTNIK